MAQGPRQQPAPKGNETREQRTRVFIVDDSPTSRLALRRIVEEDGRALVVGEAADGQRAVEKIPRLRPDIVLMDIIMGHMDGLSATRALMERSPLPVLIISDLVGGNTSWSFKALEAGALDVIRKPTARDLDDPVAGARLRRKIHLLSQVPVVTRRRSRAQLQDQRPPRPAGTWSAPTTKVSLVCLGASTGGPAALQLLLSAIATPPPWPILIVQHITSGFTDGMARWLHTTTGHDVEIAEHRSTMAPGKVYVAGEGGHLQVGGQQLLVVDTPPVNGHRPSVDALFTAVAGERIAAETVAVLLTGMGRDGASGLGKIRAAGGWTVAQDERTSVVFGMPGVAIEQGAACEVAPIDRIAAWLGALSGRLGIGAA